MKLSVIIVKTQENQNIEKLTQQLEQQTLASSEFEVLIGDVYGPEADALRRRDKNPVAYARNQALKQAQGDYVLFLEDRNRLQPEALEYLLSMMEPKDQMSVDMASCGYVLTFGDDIVDYSPERTVRVFDQEDSMCRQFYVQHYQGYVFHKLFRRSILQKYRLKFRENLFQNEERVFLLEYLKRSKLVRMAPEILVGYELLEETQEESTPEGEAIKEKTTAEEMREFEQELTGIEAFRYMMKAVRRCADARWLCQQNMAFEALQKYYEVLQTEHPEDYAKTSLRKYGKKMKSWDYVPATEEDAELLESFLQFGATGTMHY